MAAPGARDGEGPAVAVIAISILLAAILGVIAPHGVFRGPFDATDAFWRFLIALAAAAIPLATSRPEDKGAARIVAAICLVGGIFAWYGSFPTSQAMTKGFAGLAMLALLAATPLAFAEGWYDRRFRKEEDRLRAGREWASETPHYDDRGEGTLFEAPDAAVLVLRPTGGVGAPRVVPVEPRPSTEVAPEGGHENGRVAAAQAPALRTDTLR